MSVEEELARTSAEVARLPRPALDALAPALAQAQRETAIALRAWLARTDGERRYTTQVHRTVLAGLEHAFAAIARLDPVLGDALQRASAAGGHLAGHHLVSEIARFSARFEGAPRHLPLNVTRIVATGERELVPRFRTSAARYAGDVGADIRRELAVGILRRESVSELVDRLARLGGPRGRVALRGEAGEPGAVVEHISEGLFRRYRHWGERLVRTEVQRAYNVQVDAGLHEARQHLPDLQRRWDASLDARVCSLCAGLHGQVAELEKPFLGGYTEAPAHPNCRCRVGAWRAAWSEALRAGRRPLREEGEGEGELLEGQLTAEEIIAVLESYQEETPEGGRIGQWIRRCPDVLGCAVYGSLGTVGGNPVTGDFVDGIIRIAAIPRRFRPPLVRGETHTVSSAAPDARSAYLRTWTHEVGEVIYSVMPRESQVRVALEMGEARRQGRLLTGYQVLNNDYFAELFTAYFHERAVLNPREVLIVEKALQEVGL